MNEGCKIEFSLSEMGMLTRSSTDPDNISTQHYKASGITITQKAYAGIWPSKMKNNGLHFPILRKGQNMEDRIYSIPLRLKLTKITSFLKHPRPPRFLLYLFSLLNILFYRNVITYRLHVFKSCSSLHDRMIA